ncbi:MAG: hypothetical protein JRN54_04210 [Nitrososphaerota archaeon]|jgi:hypothetical protein|nr:hypothetical protein [Nitrososphaerota archaeon]
MSEYAMVTGVVRGNDAVRNLFEPGFVLQENDALLASGGSSDLGVLEARAKAA